MSQVMGIDLGTTNSVMAVVQAGPKILINKENEPQTRSVVGWRKNNVLVGTPALNRWHLAARDTIISIKRLMGRAYDDPHVQRVIQDECYQYKIAEPVDGTRDSVRVQMGGQHYSPMQISAFILKKMKEDAKDVLGEEPSHAVITVPAYFSDKQRAATREAALVAGLNVIQLLDEPTAAAIAFGIEEGTGDQPQTLLVYDLGGGTFDISVLMVGGGTYAPLNLEGDMWLGGDNFDERIMDWVQEEIRRQYGLAISPHDHRQMVELRRIAQKAKEALSASASTEIIVDLKDGAGNLVNAEVELSRAQFENLIAPLVKDSIELVQRAVHGANLELKDIDYVLLAGNATSVPLVRQEIEKLFGRNRVLRKVHPKQCVAIGAAILAARRGPVQECPNPGCRHSNPESAQKCEKCNGELSALVRCLYCDHLNPPGLAQCGNPDCGRGLGPGRGQIAEIAGRHYAIQTIDGFHVFVRKGDPCTPDVETQHFHTRQPNQRIISIPVLCLRDEQSIEGSEKQGEAFAILPPGLLKGTPVHLKLWLDENLEFNISGYLGDGTLLKPFILRGNIDQKAIKTYEDAEARLGQLEQSRGHQQEARIGSLRNQFFDRLQRASGAKASKDRLFAEAEAQAQQLLALIEELARGARPGRLQALKNAIGWVRAFTSDYGPVLTVETSQKLVEFISRGEEILQRGDEAAAERLFDELDADLSTLPEG
ncbi:MAG: Hsp70 family protein, partial [Terriglobia bacterium]